MNPPRRVGGPDAPDVRNFLTDSTDTASDSDDRCPGCVLMGAVHPCFPGCGSS